MEEWKDVVGYEGLYEVSNLGRIRSKTRKTKFGRGWRIYESQILKPQEDKDGYHKVGLSKSGKKKRFFVHRVVATAFIVNSKNKPLVNHKDGNKQNNEVSNLEWVTHSENDLHAFKTGLRKPSNGGTNKHVLQIDLESGDVIAEYESITESARTLGCSVSAISDACRGRTNKALGFAWRFK